MPNARRRDPDYHHHSRASSWKRRCPCGPLHSCRAGSYSRPILSGVGFDGCGKCRTVSRTPVDFNLECSLVLHRGREDGEYEVERKKPKRVDKILLFHMKVDWKWIHGSKPARIQRSRCRGPFSLRSTRTSSTDQNDSTLVQSCCEMMHPRDFPISGSTRWTPNRS